VSDTYTFDLSCFMNTAPGCNSDMHVLCSSQREVIWTVTDSYRAFRPGTDNVQCCCILVDLQKVNCSDKNIMS